MATQPSAQPERCRGARMAALNSARAASLAWRARRAVRACGLPQRGRAVVRPSPAVCLVHKALCEGAWVVRVRHLQGEAQHHGLASCCGHQLGCCQAQLPGAGPHPRFLPPESCPITDASFLHRLALRPTDSPGRPWTPGAARRRAKLLGRAALDFVQTAPELPWPCRSQPPPAAIQAGRPANCEWGPCPGQPRVRSPGSLPHRGSLHWRASGLPPAGGWQCKKAADERDSAGCAGHNTLTSLPLVSGDGSAPAGRSPAGWHQTGGAAGAGRQGERAGLAGSGSSSATHSSRGRGGRSTASVPASTKFVSKARQPARPHPAQATSPLAVPARSQDAAACGPAPAEPAAWPRTPFSIPGSPGLRRSGPGRKRPRQQQQTQLSDRVGQSLSGRLGLPAGQTDRSGVF